MPAWSRHRGYPFGPIRWKYSITDETLERIVRALFTSLGVVALIAMFAYPSIRTDGSATPAATDGTPGATARPSEAPLSVVDKGAFATVGTRSFSELTRQGARISLESLARAPQTQMDGIPREFYFARLAYNGFGGFYGRGGSWATDYPKADQIFLSFIDRLLPNLDAYEREFVMQVNNPDVRRFPLLYALEVGRMSLTPPEIVGLRDYLLAGGFLIIDDFWGTQEWQQFEYQMRQVLPDHQIVDLDIDHPIFTTFYEIDEIIQVPNVGQGVRGGRTYERDGIIPQVKGIHDENGRLMVIINWNTDLGDAWEWADDPYYPLKYSTYAYEMGVNFIVYAMSH